jgi:hypothetical protein
MKTEGISPNQWKILNNLTDIPKPLKYVSREVGFSVNANYNLAYLVKCGLIIKGKLKNKGKDRGYNDIRSFNITTIRLSDKGVLLKSIYPQSI